jgi:glyoxylase-like metal-dependent hydrolase (beta-lactamase superfamily II)
MRFGELQIHALSEGRFTVGLDKRFVPHQEGQDLPAGGLFISVSPFLIVSPSDVMLIDTGLGEFAEGRDISRLLGALAEHGVDREDVTRILLSHLHYDHIGGAIFSAEGTLRPTFPEAEYVVQRQEVTAPYGTGRSAEIRQQVVDVLDQHGQLSLFDGDGFLNDEIEFRVTGGHTPFHQAIYLHNQGLTAVFAGDVLGTPGHINKRFTAKYDYEPERSQAERVRIVQDAADHGQLLLFYHSPGEPAAFVSGPDVRKGFTIERIAT